MWLVAKIKNNNYEIFKNEILKIENTFRTFGNLLVLKRIIKRFIGKILNFLGIKSFILSFFKRS